MVLSLKLNRLMKKSSETATAENKLEDGILTVDKLEAGETRIVREIRTNDEEMKAFLFRLGCYEGEPITLISKKGHGCVVAIKDGRYNLDDLLSAAILV